MQYALHDTDTQQVTATLHDALEWVGRLHIAQNSARTVSQLYACKRGKPLKR